MIKIALCLVVMLLPMIAIASGKNYDDANALQNRIYQQYNCIYKSFFKEAPRTQLEKDQELDEKGVLRIASLLPDSMRQAFTAAARDTYHSLGLMSAANSVNPKAYFEPFIGNLSMELPNYIHVKQCDEQVDLNGDLYDVAVNRYVSDIIGNGKMHQWFVDNGGTYVESAFIAALLSIELSGRKPNLDAWKRYYKEHVERKFHKK